MVWLQYFMLFIAFQGIFFSMILLYITPSKRRVINILFSVLLISISFYLLANSIAGFPIYFPRTYMLSNVFIYVFTPVFYLLLCILFDDLFKFKKEHSIYLIPITVYLIFLFKYVLLTDEQLLQKLKSGDFIDLYLIDLLTFIFNLYIVYKCWCLFKKYKVQLKLLHKRAIIIFIGLILLNNLFWINKVFLHLLGVGIEINLTNDSIYWVTFSLLIFFPLTFFVIHSSFFKDYILTKTFNKKIEDESEPRSIKSLIVRIMKEQKPYLNPEFTLTELSKLSHVNKYQLSKVINHYMNTTFFKFINSYRLKEFIELAEKKQYKNISLINIAYDAGFKSKSTFYKVFKEEKKLAPKDYLKSINSSYYKS